MILLWLLCVGLVLGGLLASLASEVPWGRLHLRWARLRAVLVPVPQRATRDRRGPALAPPGRGTRAGPPGFPRGVG